MLWFSKLPEEEIKQLPVLLEDPRVLEQQLEGFAVLLPPDRARRRFRCGWERLYGAGPSRFGY